MSKWFYCHEELEALADSVNQRYFPERLDKPMPLDHYRLLEALGLDVEWKYISPNIQVSGMIFFDDGYWYIWPKGKYEKGDIPSMESFPRKTVIINQKVLDEGNENKERFICNHEVSHWIKDQNYFQNHSNEIMTVCKEDSMRKTYWNDSMSEIDIIERQTNYLNAAILLPKEVIKNEFFRLLRYRNIPEEPIEFKPFMKKAIGIMVKEFGVNFNPIKYRLKDLGIIYDD